MKNKPRRTIQIDKDIFIGEDSPCFVIAEISSNHGKSFKRAVSLIRKAKASGADAVKFQAYTPDSLTIDVKNKYFRIKHPQWGSQTLYELYKNSCTPWKWFKKLKKEADKKGIVFFATAFDKKAVDFLEDLKVPIHKIASFELADLGLIDYIARTKKPLIMSTGMASLKEIEDAVQTAINAGVKELILLKCTSSYPARPEDLNLRTIGDMKARFGCPVGLSDHSLGNHAIGVPIVARAMGARVIEKHFTLSRKFKTPDSFFSMEPYEMRTLVNALTLAEQGIGYVRYGATEEELKNVVFRRSLFATEDIKKGEILTEQNVRSIRPGYGLPPKHLKSILGKTAKKDIKKGTPLAWDLV